MRTLRAPPLSRQTCAWEERAAPSAPRLTPRARAHACTPQLLPSLSREVPKKAVALAALLLCAGTSLLIAALALGAQGTQHATPLFVLGAVMFLPVRRAALAGVAMPGHKCMLTPPPSPCACARQGAYYTRLAYKAWQGAEGYSFDALPLL
jgi:hypothetical protein